MSGKGILSRYGEYHSEQVTWAFTYNPNGGTRIQPIRKDDLEGKTLNTVKERQRPNNPPPQRKHTQPAPTRINHPEIYIYNDFLHYNVHLRTTSKLFCIKPKCYHWVYFTLPDSVALFAATHPPSTHASPAMHPPTTR